ncbi:MAG: deoxyribodipyrimidine photo-lyase [Bacteroidales bacterium]|nr:deoxyribodipyrimidine photo-lyase [Bacteroidales bacterium]
MINNEKIAVFWFRRDLRLEDNVALYHALTSNFSVLPIFIFDPNILNELDRNDSRVSFIYQTLFTINFDLKQYNSGLKIYFDEPLDAWKKIVSEFNVAKVFYNSDYEPYAKGRDTEINTFLAAYEIEVQSFKDHVIFEKNEILKSDETPYTIFTPYKNTWLNRFSSELLKTNKSRLSAFIKQQFHFPELSEIGFELSSKKVKPFNIDELSNYHNSRDIPSIEGTSNLGPHLRFGTISIRVLISKILGNDLFLSELIWREFFMQILWHFPRVVHNNFKRKYDGIQWQNNKTEFKKWCNGETGYPLVDAGMRQLNETGYMHNRVRMVTASFLCKHLLIDWRWGEAYFAKHLLDFDLSSNNGNWQWAAGTGCDAAPYFRVFNPSEQQKKFDPKAIYIRKWVKEFDSLCYPQPMVDHKEARDRAIRTYKEGILK